MDGMGLSLGNGNQTSFWEDEWVNDINLNNSFPRIYALVVKKVDNIGEFGSWNGNEWTWNGKTSNGRILIFS